MTWHLLFWQGGGGGGSVLYSKNAYCSKEIPNIIKINSIKRNLTETQRPGPQGNWIKFHKLKLQYNLGFGRLHLSAINWSLWRGCSILVHVVWDTL